MGNQEHPEDAYNLVNTNMTEGFPLSIIEAMACGKAVVARNVGGMNEAIANCGIMIKNHNLTEFASEIIKLLKDVQLRNKLEISALRNVSEQFGNPGR